MAVVGASGAPPLFRLRRPVARQLLPLPGGPRPEPRLRIGLLGGSFNPAHDGHRYISTEALERLGLDQVWWLVAPQNPLKPRHDMAPFAERMARAREVARHPRLRVTDLEARLGTRYTVDTLHAMQARLPHRFVWLIGADNLVQLPRWRHWQRLLELVPVAVFDRAHYLQEALAGIVAHRLEHAFVAPEAARDLVQRAPPAWTYVRLRRHRASGTAIRRAESECGQRKEMAP
jgi:nicotinate-nucleotide adenylyltransferase